MASYTRLIEFKVKDTELNRAVNKLSKTLDRIDKSLVGIDKKLDHIAKQGFGGIAKEANKAEKSVGKLAKSVKGMSGPQGFTRMLTGAALKGIIGKRGDIADAVVRLGALDAAIRLLTKGNAGLPALNRRLVEAATALTGFTLAHTGAIAAVVGGSAAILTGTKFFYDLGKGVRQAEANMIDFIKTSRQIGVGKGLRSLFPKGSLWGGDKRDTTPSFDGKNAAAAVDKELGRTFSGQRSPVTGFGSLGSLDTHRKALAHTKQIQEKLVALTGKHLQASIQVRKTMIGYNLELAKTKVVQGFVTADLWAMQKAWQGVVGTLKGAKDLVGGLFGGKFGGAGKGLGVITLTRGIEFLTGKLGFLNKAWIDNTNAIALWSARASEAITAVNIVYTGFSKVLGAAQWTTGAISGFMRWEEQAMLSIRRINTARDDLDKRMAGLLDKGQNPFTGFGKWIRGESGERGVKAQLADRGESNQERIGRELDVQRRLLKATNTTAKDYLQIQKEIVKLEGQQSREVERRLAKQVEAGESASRVYKDEYDEFQRVTQQKRKDITSLERQEKKARADVQKAAGKQYEADLKAIKDNEAEVIKSKQRIQEATIRLAKQTASRQRSIEQQRSQEAARFRENMMLGAGFPLLFGGGLGSVAGGVTGAALSGGGKGFGAQILLSAIGQQIDNFINKIRELGEAFVKPTENIDALINAIGQKGTPIGEMAEQLKEAGLEASAAALLLDKFNNQFGTLTDKSMLEVGKESMELNNQLAILGTSIKLLTVGPLTSFIKTINQGLIGPQTAVENVQHLFEKGEASRKPRTRLVLSEAFEKITGQQVKDLVDNKIPQSVLESPAFKASVRRFLDEVADPGGAEGREKSDFIMAESKRLTDRAQGKEIGQLEKKIALEKEKLTITDKEYQIKIKQLEIDKIAYELETLSIEKNARTKLGLDTKEIDNKIKKLVLTKQLGEAELDNLKTLSEVNELYASIEMTIEEGIVTAIEAAIKGTKTLGEVASQVLDQIARKMLQSGVSALFDKINPMSFLTKNKTSGPVPITPKAAGGPVSGGSPYIVGEKGPELFVPGSSGSIVPNNALGGGMVINVDASGSSVEGDANKSRELGQLIGVAVQAEIGRQQRPGGMLY